MTNKRKTNIRKAKANLLDLLLICAMVGAITTIVRFITCL